jgi:ribosomal protein S18 acetylase RimI-like enzyme
LSKSNGIKSAVKRGGCALILKIYISNELEAQQIFDLQRASYAIEAEIIRYSELPPLKETLEMLLQSQETYYGYFFNKELAGAISYKMKDSTLDIHKMMVHPKYFRKGIAGSLLRFIYQAETGIKEIIVSTGSKNEPAKKLYESHGFKEIRKIEVSKGIFITNFRKSILH